MTFQDVRQLSETNDAVESFMTPDTAIHSRTRNDTLLEWFGAHFYTQSANTIERVRLAQRIRYQVYCVEHPHEKSDNPDGLEMDEFDSHAAQSLLIHRASNEALGTVRLILPLADELKRSFPIQRVMDENSLRMFNELPLHSMAEVSRFSISRQLRRMTDAHGSPQVTAVTRNSGPLMRLGLMQAQVRMSMQYGITHLCSAMEPDTSADALQHGSIRFRPVGPLVRISWPAPALLLRYCRCAKRAAKDTSSLLVRYHGRMGLSDMLTRGERLNASWRA